MTAGRTEIGIACPRCGAGSDPDARFCARCGAALVAVAAPPAVPPAVAPSSAAPPPGPPVVLPPPPGPAVVPMPAVDAPFPIAATPPGALRATSPFPGVEPSAVGRRASPLSWLGVGLGAAVFLAASLAIVGAAGVAGPGGATTPGAPLARFDQMLYDGDTVADGVPWEIEVEAVNPATAPTHPLWMVIDWAPDADGTAGVRGRFVACEPGSCDSSEDAVGRRTVVSWPALPAGERRVLRATVVATGLEPGSMFGYRVTTGSGPSESEMHGDYTWDLELEVE